MRPIWFLLCVAFSLCGRPSPSSAEPNPTSGNPLESYLEKKVTMIERDSARPLRTLRPETWGATRQEWLIDLRYQLGLAPWPPTSALNTTVHQTVTRDGIVVESLSFESRPGLVVTANLYRPETIKAPLPAILYVCGHAPVVRDGVTYGNKVAYQRHGVWFANHGYVCLTLDTLQLGEIEGLHHGTYRHDRWDWFDQGYTPAGVEAWNGIRGLDYLQSRPEIDPNRIGMTGRSGGGATTWWVAALDDRVRAAVPVAGITSLRNHVVDRCVEGHCDCMYFPNSQQWDFSRVSALVAPRALLITNSDKDSIFPLDGVMDVYWRTRQVYDHLGFPSQLGLAVEEGPHKDTQPLRVSAFHWFERFLKGKELTDELVDSSAPEPFAPSELKALDALPDSALNGRIDHHWWDDRTERRDRDAEALANRLQSVTFRAWPKEDTAPSIRVLNERTWSQATALELEFDTESPLSARLYLYLPNQKTHALRLHTLSHDEWPSFQRTWAGLPSAQSTSTTATAWLTPRDTGALRWNLEPRRRVHVRRSLALLGETIDSGKVYDILRAIKALESPGLELKDHSITLSGRGGSGFLSLIASLYADRVHVVDWADAPEPTDPGGHLLNWRRETGLSSILAAVASVRRVDIAAPSPVARSQWEALVQTLPDPTRAQVTVR